MIYQDFLFVLENAKKHTALLSNNNNEDFPHYLEQINLYLNNYFTKHNLLKKYELLKGRAVGKTLEELGNNYGVTRERIRQIIAKTIIKLRDKFHIERNTELKELYSFLCSIGEYEILGFINYLMPKKHVLLMIVSDDLYKESLRADVTQNMKEKIKKSKKKIKRINTINYDYKKMIIKFLKKTNIRFTSLMKIADCLVEESQNEAIGRIDWDKIMETLLDMQTNGELKRIYGSYRIA